MKTLNVIIAVVVAVTVSGCASTRYTEYRGQDSFPAEGGTIQIIDGIDLWRSGTPDRPYKILGVIDKEFAPAYMRSFDKAIVKDIVEYGGQAGIILNRERIRRAPDAYATHFKIAVIRYL